eukprot:jgi/Bigna1/82438/fgenesh1_pg.92_\
MVAQDAFVESFKRAKKVHPTLLTDLIEAKRNVDTVRKESELNKLRLKCFEYKRHLRGNNPKHESRNIRRAILEVEVLEAKNLPMLDANGSVDPFVIAKVDTSRPQYTITNKQNKNPIWNAKFFWEIQLEIPGAGSATASKIEEKKKKIVATMTGASGDDDAVEADRSESLSGTAANPGYLQLEVWDLDYASENDVIATTATLCDWFEVMRTPQSPHRTGHHDEPARRVPERGMENAETKDPDPKSLYSSFSRNGNDESPFPASLGKVLVRVSIKHLSSQEDDRSPQLSNEDVQRVVKSLRKALAPLYEYEAKNDKVARLQHRSQVLVSHFPAEIETVHSRFDHVTLTVSGMNVAKGRLVCTDLRVMGERGSEVFAERRREEERQGRETASRDIAKTLARGA